MVVVQHVNPPELPVVGLYHQVSVATGSRLISVAGQVATDRDGNTVGPGDLAAQVERAYLNVAAALESVGAGFGDVVRLTAYFVDWTPDKFAALSGGIERASRRLGFTPAPPFTGIGVAALAAPDLLVELEATAVLD